MILKLFEVSGYKGNQPLTGRCLCTFFGNKKQCTTAAKDWIKEQQFPVGKSPIMKWV